MLCLLYVACEYVDQYPGHGQIIEQWKLISTSRYRCKTVYFFFCSGHFVHFCLTELFRLLRKYGPRYNWTSTEQSHLLGSYFWGYLVTSLPAGVIAEWIGGRTVVGVTMGLSGILTALIPFCAGISFWTLFIVRMSIGVLGVSAQDAIIAKLYNIQVI